MLIRAGLHPHTAHASMLYRAASCTTSSDYYVVTIKVLSAARRRFPAGRNSISTCAVVPPVRFGIFDKAHMMPYRAAPCTTSSDYYVVTIKVSSAARQRFPAGRNSISTCAVFRPVRFGIFDKAHMRLPRRGVNPALYAA